MSASGFEWTFCGFFLPLAFLPFFSLPFFVFFCPSFFFGASSSCSISAIIGFDTGVFALPPSLVSSSESASESSCVRLHSGLSVLPAGCFVSPWLACSFFLCCSIHTMPTMATTKTKITT